MDILKSKEEFEALCSNSVRHICKNCKSFKNDNRPTCRKTDERVGEYETCGKWVCK